MARSLQELSGPDPVPVRVMRDLDSVLIFALLATIAPLPAQRDVGEVRELPAHVRQGGVPASLAEWRAFESHLRATHDKVRAALVGLGGGSGVVVEGGFVLTAGHVIGAPGRRVTMSFDDGRSVQGTTLGVNHRTDTGLVRLDDAEGLPCCAMGSLAEVEAGDWCFMLGHPGGRRPAGAPLRLGRVLRPDAARFVVTDCTMSGGDSGGPLFDLEGRVIGIHSRIAQDLADNLHVPIDAFRREWDSLLASELVGTADRRGNARTELPARLRAFGLRVSAAIPPVVDAVLAATPAAEAGFQVGDVIVEIDGRRLDVESANVARARSGSVTRVVVRRGEADVPLVLEAEPLEVGLRSARGRGGELPHGARNHREVLESFLPLSDALRNHVVAVFVGESRVALGTIVRADGRVLTKASELRDGELRCELADGTRVPARRLAIDPATDLALLAIEAQDLVPVAWDTRAPEVGRVLVSIGTESAPLSIGVVSLPVHEPASGGAAARGGRPTERPGELGLVFLHDEDDARVFVVRDGSAAQRAGCLANDVVREIDGVVMGSREAVIEALRSKHAGQPVTLRVLRGTDELSIEAILGERRNAAEGRQPRNPQEFLFGPLSAVRSGFPEVLVHDTVLTPAQCGGPIAGLDGHLHGINVARAGRVESVALSAKCVVEAISRLEVAARGR